MQCCMTVKSCNIKHNSESVFCYFASATRVQNVIEKIVMLSVVTVVMQTLDVVSGLHNCQEFSQPLECLYQAMLTPEKKSSITVIK